jgi:5-(carboxyamino)imidazole ribonucleotide synthase
MRIGIIGAGQLGQMLGEAAAQLGHECHFLDPAENPPAARVGKVAHAAFDDRPALALFARSSDVITYEFENVQVAALEEISIDRPVYPPPAALRLAQDRLWEKQLFEQLDIPVPGYRAIDCRDDLYQAAATLGYPLVVKTRRFGYDGKGQIIVHNERDAEAAWQYLQGRPLIAESWVNFDYEVSIIGARGLDGATAVWPLTRNEHASGILRCSRAPEADADIRPQANEYLQRLLGELQYVGVLALELFVCGGRLLANEFAPRVHNSGHWTIEGSTTSQFANHIRAITKTSLQTADCPGFAGMLNLIGTMPDSAGLAGHAGITLHDYGKQARPGRKLGHVTVVAGTAAARDDLLDMLDQIVTQST